MQSSIPQQKNKKSNNQSDQITVSNIDELLKSIYLLQDNNQFEKEILIITIPKNRVISVFDLSIFNILIKLSNNHKSIDESKSNEQLPQLQQEKLNLLQESNIEINNFVKLKFEEKFQFEYKQLLIKISLSNYNFHFEFEHENPKKIQPLLKEEELYQKNQNQYKDIKGKITNIKVKDQSKKYGFIKTDQQNHDVYFKFDKIILIGSDKDLVKGTNVIIDYLVIEDKYYATKIIIDTETEPKPKQEIDKKKKSEEKNKMQVDIEEEQDDAEIELQKQNQFKDIKGKITNIAVKDQSKKYGFIKTDQQNHDVYFKFDKIMLIGSDKDLIKGTYVIIDYQAYQNRYKASKIRIDTQRELVKQKCVQITKISNGQYELDPDDYEDIQNLENILQQIIINQKEEYDRKLINISKIRNLQNQFQVCFLLDCTGSMQQHMDSCKDRINELKEEFEKKKIRQLEFAFCGYRDKDDQYPKNQNLDFTTSTEKFSQIIAAQEAKGGDDEAEDVHDGLESVMDLKWNQSNEWNKILIHVADAQCHGKFFTTKDYDVLDDYKSFDSDGSLAKKYLKDIVVKKNVFYFFLEAQANPKKTASMIKKFNELISDLLNSEGIKEQEEINSRLIKSVSCVDAKSIMNLSIKSSLETLELNTLTAIQNFDLQNEEQDQQNQQKIDDMIQKNKTNRNQDQIKQQNNLQMLIGSDSETYPGHQKVQWITIKLPKSMDELKTNLLRNDIDIRHVKIETQQLCKGGSLRNVFKAQLSIKPHYLSSGKEQKVIQYYVAKIHKQFKKIEIDKKNVLNDLQCQTIAAYLAQQFSELDFIKNQNSKIRFLKAVGIQFVEKYNSDLKRFRYGCLEKIMDVSEYEKWNNNYGYVSETNFSALINAFAHWTYEITNGFILVCDLQGIKESDNQYVLTDPCIHSTDITRFGSTNLGEEGIKKFFETHICNQICANLHLPRNKWQEK